jgi:hypothetical protein
VEREDRPSAVVTKREVLARAAEPANNRHAEVRFSDDRSAVQDRIHSHLLEGSCSWTVQAEGPTKRSHGTDAFARDRILLLVFSVYSVTPTKSRSPGATHAALGDASNVTMNSLDRQTLSLDMRNVIRNEYLFF